MFLDSSAGIKTLVDNAPFDVGVSDLPVPKEEDRQGVAIGEHLYGCLKELVMKHLKRRGTS